ncbi:PQQ-binding-like beta-propeller repeat protein [Phenylobacterium sp.]|uniref:outer membrane protein assembly factor BamB family protein n=1 Tax=Phenylobacterium sp. TaxID=1871053 RepID=UPI003784EDA9
MFKRGLCGVAALALACAVPLTGSVAQTGSSEWPLLGGNVGSQQFSPLDQINQSNVKSLGLLWHADLPLVDGLVGNPLVKDGVIYQSAPRGVVLAHDLASGKLLWTYEPDLDLSEVTLTALYGVNNNRGVALDDDRVYVNSGACELHAVDRRTGKEAWRAKSCDAKGDYGIIMAPRVGGGMVFVGNNNHELGTERGFVDAFDAKTGKRVWRVYTVPGDPSKPFETPQMELASKTWGPDYWKLSKGGGNPWEGMTYDPVNDYLIFGTGNPNTWGKEKSFGDHDMLYASSIIAVKAKTGEYVWHHQYVQGDVWDLGDGAAHIVLAELPLPGGKRRVVMQAAKNGYFYLFDAKTGEFISANNYVPVTNYGPMDPKTGKLTVKEDLKQWKTGKQVVAFPGGWGSHTWTLMSYNPQTGLAYIPAFLFPSAYGDGGEIPLPNRHGRLVAWDPIKQEERWHVDLPMTINGGTLSTAGNLVLQGTPDGKFVAYAADTGKVLWSYNTGSVILAGPSTVTVNGKQVILVPAGDGGGSVTVKAGGDLASTPQTALAPSRLLAFGLGGDKRLPPTPVKRLTKPVRPPQPQELAARGKRVYDSNSCSLCHGPAAVTGGSHVPDLRMIQEARFEAMPDILKHGALRQTGMPQFEHFSDDDVRALQAYIINRGWEDYGKEQAQVSRSKAR